MGGKIGTCHLTTPVTLASLHGHLEIVKLLLEKGVDTNKESGPFNFLPAQAAAIAGHTEVLKLLLDSDSKQVTLSNQSGLSLLQASEISENFETIRFLLNKGENLRGLEEIPDERLPSSINLRNIEKEI